MLFKNNFCFQNILVQKFTDNFQKTLWEIELVILICFFVNITFLVVKGHFEICQQDKFD